MALTDAQKEKLLKLGQLAKFKELADAKYEDKISDLATIRSGAAAGATAYQKPGTGIPASDMAQAVQEALTAAGTALQASDLTTLEGKVAALEALVSDGENATAAIDKFNEIVAFLANITNTQTLEGIVSGINTSIAAKYTKPSTGIPKSDLASDVQASLGKADTAIQSHQDISGKADKDTDAVEGNFAAFDANGNPVDSGKKHADYKTKQTAVSDPTANGNAIEFISGITQNANGEIVPEKKALQAAQPYVDASTPGQAGSMSAADKAKLDAISYATDSDVAALFA